MINSINQDQKINYENNYTEMQFAFIINVYNYKYIVKLQLFFFS